MTPANLLKETLDVNCDEVWEDKRNSTPVQVFGVRLHSMGLSLREVIAVSDLFGVDRSNGAVWNWTHTLREAQSNPPTAAPSRVAVDEKRVLMDIDVFIRRWSDTAAAFLHRLTQKQDLSDAEFLVGAAGYLNALTSRELNGQLIYSERNHIEKWFQSVSMRNDRFHTFRQGSPTIARRWLRRFRHHYNYDKPNQTLDGRTSGEEVLN